MKLTYWRRQHELNSHVKLIEFFLPSFKFETHLQHILSFPCLIKTSKEVWKKIWIRVNIVMKKETSRLFNFFVSHMRFHKTKKNIFNFKSTWRKLNFSPAMCWHQMQKWKTSSDTCFHDRQSILTFFSCKHDRKTLFCKMKNFSIDSWQKLSEKRKIQSW